MTAEEAIEAIRELARANRCGDSGCIYARPGGMATNGGCRCARDDGGSRYDDGVRAMRNYVSNVKTILAKVPS